MIEKLASVFSALGRLPLAPIALSFSLLAFFTNTVFAVVVEGEFEATIVPFTANFSYETVDDGFIRSFRPSGQILLQPLQDFVALNPIISGSFSWDTDSPTSSTGSNVARYDGTKFSSTVIFPGGATIELLDKAPSVQIFDNAASGIGSSRDSLSINSRSFFDRALTFDNPSPSTFVFDLKEDTRFIQQASNLPNLQNLPIRISIPDAVVHIFAFNLNASDGTRSVFSNFDLPTSVALEDFNSRFLYMQANANTVEISVDIEDYSNDEDFQLANTYVRNNLLNLSITWNSFNTLTRLSASSQVIPEPSSIALMLSAFLGLSCVARRRVNLPRGLASGA